MKPDTILFPRKASLLEVRARAISLLSAAWVVVAGSASPPEASIAIDVLAREDIPLEARGVIHDSDRPAVAQLTITRPENGERFAAPAAIAIEVTAVDPEGYISHVEFHANDERIGASRIDFFRAPDPGTPIHHRFEWNDVPVGEYMLSARATDSSGEAVLSHPVKIAVGEAGPERALVTIVAVDPDAAEPGSHLEPGLEIDEGVDRSDAEKLDENGEPEVVGPVNTALLRIHRTGSTDFAMPVYLTFEGAARNGVDYVKIPEVVTIPEGESQFDLVIFPLDDRVVEGTERVVIRVLPPICIKIFPPPRECYLVGKPASAKAAITDSDQEKNSPPRVEIVKPRAGQQFRAPASILMVAHASDPDGRIAGLEFFANGERLGDQKRRLDWGPRVPFVYFWKDVSAGRYELTVKATDDGGASTVSDPVGIVVLERDLQKTLEITEPKNGAVFEAKADIRLTAVAVDPKGYIPRVEFLANGRVVGGSEIVFIRAPEPGTPIEHSFTWEDVEAGTYSLLARAEDSAGKRIVSRPVEIQVGEETIAPVIHHPADHDSADGRITESELTAYADAWLGSADWPIPPNPIPISYVTRAGALWRGGETYRFNPSAGRAPLWWVNAPLLDGEMPGLVEEMTERAADSDLIALGRATIGAATREFSIDASTGEAVAVTIRVAPATGVMTYAVEDRLPRGWSASEIDPDGASHEANGTVKWGPYFDDSPRVFTYRSSPTAGDQGLARFKAVVSFDGIDVPVTGVKRQHEEVFLRFSAVTGREYGIEGSRDLRHWVRLGRATSANGEVKFVDPESGDLPHRFYRLVPVP